MSSSLHDIPLTSFFWLLLPALPVFGMLYFWQMDFYKAIRAMARMILQLLAIGYVLTYIFTSQSPLQVALVLIVMMGAATWISLNPLTRPGLSLYRSALLAIGIGGSLILAIVVIAILKADPWYNPRLIIPLAGMIYVVSMTAISQSAERLVAEIEAGADYIKARKAAANAAMIPTINSLFAVGLVSLPGMMTGQILSGVSPLIAVKYQIVVMVMSFSSTGLATLVFLSLSGRTFVKEERAVEA